MEEEDKTKKMKFPHRKFDELTNPSGDTYNPYTPIIILALD